MPDNRLAIGSPSWQTLIVNPNKNRNQRVEHLVAEFPSLVSEYDRNTPFVRSGQLESHRSTIAIRRAHPTSARALADHRFVTSLYETLQAWGIGVRASVLVPIDEFNSVLTSWANEFNELDGAIIGDPSLDHDWVGNRLWQLIEAVEITGNKSKLVALSKTIHHILPDLLPPIDRAYTQKFYLINTPEFQNNPERVFRLMWQGFTTIARQVDLSSYVGDGWRTSRTKVIDNAIVAFVKKEKPPEAKRRTHTRRPSESEDLGTEYSIPDLYSKLSEFENELRAAELKQNTVNTYVGRSTTFVDWLAGRYHPRGPNEEQ